MSQDLVLASRDRFLEARQSSEAFSRALKTMDPSSDDFKMLGPMAQRAIARKAASLSHVSGSRGWWPLIQEMSSGAWQRNEEVRVDTALSNPTLFSVVTLIAGDIAKLRPMLVERDDDGIWSEIESPAFSPVLRKPNHYQTRIDFFEWWLISKLCHGNTYALKARDGRGVVRAMYVLDPFRVKPLVAPDGSVFYELHPHELSGLESAVTVPASEIMHDVMCPLFHELCGVSPIYAAGFPALQGLTMRKSSDKFFANGSRPGGVILVPGAISQQQALNLKQQWETGFGGDNVGKIAVLSDGMKYEGQAQTAEQSQLVAQLGMTDEDICKCYHMPRYKVGVGPDPKYDNVEALDKQYHGGCLQKHIEKLELVLDWGLGLTSVEGKRIGVEFDRDDLYQMDTGRLLDAAEKAMKAGASPNEVRKRYHHLGPVTGGESPLAQQQYYSLEALAKRDAAQAPPPTQPAQLQGESKSYGALEMLDALAAYHKAWELAA